MMIRRGGYDKRQFILKNKSKKSKQLVRKCEEKNVFCVILCERSADREKIEDNRSEKRFEQLKWETARGK